MIYDFKFVNSPQVAASISAASYKQALGILRRKFPRLLQAVENDRLSVEVRKEEPLLPQSKIPKKYAGYQPGRCSYCGSSDLSPSSTDPKAVQCVNCGASQESDENESVEIAIDRLLDESDQTKG